MIRSWATQNRDWVEHWHAVIAFMGRTPLYTGKGSPGNWRADLNWLFKGSNFATALDRMRAPPAASEDVQTIQAFRERAKKGAA